MLRDPEYGEEAKLAEQEGRLSEVLIDFCLYDVCKEREAEERRRREGADTNGEHEDADGDKEAEVEEMLPHHRTRSIWY